MRVIPYAIQHSCTIAFWGENTGPVAIYHTNFAAKAVQTASVIGLF
jgi:hypothetical protein